MKHIAGWGSLALALIAGGCTPQQAAPPPLSLATRAAPMPEETSPPPPSGAELLAEQPREVQAAMREHAKSGQWPAYRTAEYVLYPYGHGAAPLVDCAPLRTTDIQLQPGATITDVAMGDTERWMATPASSGDAAPGDQATGVRPRDQPDDLHDQAHLSPATTSARRPRDAGSRVLLSGRARGGDA